MPHHPYLLTRWEISPRWAEIEFTIRSPVFETSLPSAPLQIVIIASHVSCSSLQIVHDKAPKRPTGGNPGPERKTAAVARSSSSSTLSIPIPSSLVDILCLTTTSLILLFIFTLPVPVLSNHTLITTSTIPTVPYTQTSTEIETDTSEPKCPTLPEAMPPSNHTNPNPPRHSTRILSTFLNLIPSPVDSTQTTLPSEHSLKPL